MTSVKKFDIMLASRVVQCKPRKGAQRRQSGETLLTTSILFGGECVYITESMTYDKNRDNVSVVLIWKTPDNIFPHKAERYRNNVFIAALLPVQFSYSRRGEYLVGVASDSPSQYPDYYAGVGEWRIDPKIRGNVRGCV